ncbi:hypothetical protein [Luteolibacter luteus]|uniref:Uncharacterized protein n=1 Tax=Luteolibacter luteus TaxID=2728835 RepID=A0A858RIH7_9BACT|nr:hypothetical protein [Luteolibacter luteus]QJE96229.1 hypothetical protein HHL09_10690 [Luteolibacter luteus]
MPHCFRTIDGKIRSAAKGSLTPFVQRDGTLVEAQWAGSAQSEKLGWWERKPGYQLVRTAELVAEIGIKAEDDNELNWGAVPAGAYMFFILQPVTVGKNGEPYRLAQLVTAEATPAEFAFFRDTRSALFGVFGPEGQILKMEPLEPPPPKPPPQGELF